MFREGKRYEQEQQDEQLRLFSEARGLLEQAENNEKKRKQELDKIEQDLDDLIQSVDPEEAARRAFSAEYTDISGHILGYAEFKRTIHTGSYPTTFLSPDGSLIAVTSDARTKASIFETATGKLIKEISLSDPGEPENKIFAGAFNAAATTVIITTGNNVYIVQLKKDIPVRVIPESLIKVAFNPLNEEEILCFRERYREPAPVTIRTIATWKIQTTFQQGSESNDATSFSFSPDNNYITLSRSAFDMGGSDAATVWNLATGALVWKISDRGIRNVLYSSDGNYVLTWYLNYQKITVYNAKNGEFIEYGNYFGFPNLPDIEQFYVNKNATLAILCSKDGTLYFWGIKAKKMTRTIPTGEKLRDIIFSDDNSTLAIIASKTITLYRQSSFESELVHELEIQRLRAKPHGFQALARKISNFINAPAKDSPLRVRDYLPHEDTAQSDKYLHELNILDTTYEKVATIKKAALAELEKAQQSKNAAMIEKATKILAEAEGEIKKIADTANAKAKIMEQAYEKDIVLKYRRIKNLVTAIQQDFQKAIKPYDAQLPDLRQFTWQVIKLIHEYMAQKHTDQAIIHMAEQDLLQPFLMTTIPGIEKELGAFLTDQEHREIADYLVQLKKSSEQEESSEQERPLDQKQFNETKERLAALITRAKHIQKIFARVQKEAEDRDINFGFGKQQQAIHTIRNKIESENIAGWVHEYAIIDAVLKEVAPPAPAAQHDEDFGIQEGEVA